MRSMRHDCTKNPSGAPLGFNTLDHPSLHQLMSAAFTVSSGVSVLAGCSDTAERCKVAGSTSWVSGVNQNSVRALL